MTSTYIELLQDEYQTIRENACWELGYLTVQEAEPALQACAAEDENVDVRMRASWG